jgi:hypothetical protein
VSFCVLRCARARMDQSREARLVRVTRECPSSLRLGVNK